MGAVLVTDPSVDDFLEHFGVKGMHWGVRHDRRVRNRELNRAAKAKDREKLQKKVEGARAYFAADQHKRDKAAAKSQFKENKLKLGSYTARKIRREKMQKIYDKRELANTAKNGKEAAVGVLAVAGLIGLQALASAKS